MARSGDWESVAVNRIYSAIAIETALTLRLVFHQSRCVRLEGLAAIDRGSARHRNCHSRPHDIEPPRGRVDRSTKVVWSRQTTSPHRQHWSEDLRRGRVAGSSVVFVPLGAGANCISASMPTRMKSSPLN